MAKVNIKLDKRANHMTKDGKYLLVLGIGHQSTSRNIPFDLHLSLEFKDEVVT